MENPMPKGATYIGPTVQQMVSHPSPSAFGDPYPGPIIGVNVANNKPFRFDPWWLMDNGIINAMTFLVIAALREGKSALIKLIIKSLMRLAPGGRMPHVVINDYRPEGDGTEYTKLATWLMCTVTRMKDMRFNILDPRLYMNAAGEFSEFSLIEMIRRISEFEQKPLTEIEVLALRIVIREQLLIDPRLWGFEYIGLTSGGITEKMYTDFRERSQNKLQAELYKRLQKVDDPAMRVKLEAQHARVLSLPDNIVLDDVKNAGVSLRNRIEAIHDGVAGEVFGNEHSYYDLMTQPLSVRDWRGMNPAAERLMKLIGGRLDITAIDNNRRDLVPDVMVDDELHRAMTNSQFVEDRLFRQQITRSLGSFEIGGTHSEDSVIAGEPGSRLYRASKTILNNSGGIIYGRLPNDPQVRKEAKSRSGLTDYEVDLLTQNPKYTFGIKFNESLPLIRFRTAPYGSDFNLIYTDSATHSKAQGNQLGDPDAKAEFALQHGSRYIGG